MSKKTFEDELTKRLDQAGNRITRPKKDQLPLRTAKPGVIGRGAMYVLNPKTKSNPDRVQELIDQFKAAHEHSEFAEGVDHFYQVHKRVTKKQRWILEQGTKKC